MILKKLAAGLCLIGLGLASPAMAREPGVPTSMPVGGTMGVPVGASPPPGLYLSSRTGFADFTLYDDNGDKVGVDLSVRDTAFQFIWVPGVKLWGGDYKALMTIPLLDIDQRLAAGLGGAHDSRFSFGQIEVRPLDVSWQVQPGIFVSTGVSVFAPTGSWSASKAVNTQGNFWTVAPSVGFSYLRDGWNASLHAIYFTNTRNNDNDYKSGDELVVNMTALKDFNGWSVGPVGYYRKQITNDDNDGSAYGGMTAGKAEQLALGLGFTHRFGPVELNVNYTKDIVHKNTVAGDRLWLNVTLPLGG